MRGVFFCFESWEEGVPDPQGFGSSRRKGVPGVEKGPKVRVFGSLPRSLSGRGSTQTGEVGCTRNQTGVGREEPTDRELRQSTEPEKSGTKD